MTVRARSRDAVLFGTTLVLFGALSVFRGADANWDLRNYHYYNAYATWTGRLGFDYGAAQVQTFLNPAVDIPFYLLIEAVPPIAFGFTLGALHGINVWLVFRLALRVLGPPAETSRALAIVFAATGVGVGTLAEIGTTFHDLTLAPLVLGGLLLLVRSRMDDVRSAGVTFGGSGLLLGLAVGLKYTFAIFVPGVAAAALLLAPHGRRRRIFAIAAWAIGLGLAFAATAGPWMLYLWSAYGSPLGPYLNNVFKSPYFEPWNFEDRRFLPKTTLQAAAYPFFFFLARQKTVWEASFREARFAAVYVLVAAVVASALIGALRSKRWSALGIGLTRLSRVEVALVLFAVTSYVVWQYKFSIYRYLIPLELLAPVLVYILLAPLVASERRRRLLSVLILIGTLLCMRVPVGGRIPWRAGDYFGTRISTVMVPETSLLLIASYEPLAFVVGALPPAVRAVRIQSNIFQPELRTRWAAEIREVIETHRGPFRLLSHARRRDQAERAVTAYGLRIIEKACERVVNHMDPLIELCVLER